MFFSLQSYVVFVPLFDVENDFQSTRVPSGSGLCFGTGVLWAQLRALSSFCVFLWCKRRQQLVFSGPSDVHSEIYGALRCVGG